jgi:hypothetical protein
MPDPSNPAGQNKWWVSHVNCMTGFTAGPFDTQADAERFRDSLVSPDSCPACGRPTPEATDYSIGQM